ncbi:putative membrane protein [Actinomadura coerulea]|uniref:Putative membrane protein n=1 Tax=Actinomadura coerulea TaxID=46159 RepID=A0A7X0G1F2_9ACTN|nr:hypothetical protein [Actinomadura coerulea]MBB6397012.1 putative membrane protein [Actinomadura coerulea]
MTWRIRVAFTVLAAFAVAGSVSGAILYGLDSLTGSSFWADPVLAVVGPVFGGLIGGNASYLAATRPHFRSRLGAEWVVVAVLAAAAGALGQVYDVAGLANLWTAPFVVGILFAGGVSAFIGTGIGRCPAN